MTRLLSVLMFLMALLLSACRGQAPIATAAPAPTETQPAAETETPAEQIPITGATEVSDTPTTPPEVSPTPPSRPANEAGCTNSAAFVSDVTIPDNTIIGAGETFTKTWRVSNTGTCIWAWDYTLAHYSEDRMGVFGAVPLEVTYPGQTADVSVNLKAPDRPGTYRGNFVINNPEGLIMKIGEDSRLWLIINVVNTAPTPTATTEEITPTSTSESSSVSETCSFTTDRTKLTETINALNAYRSQNDLPAYTVNSLLARAAQAHANDMACNNLFVHTGSDGSTPESRVATTGYVGTSVTENVYGSDPPLDGQGVVTWWANDTGDPRHNQNLLSSAYTEIGVGYAFFNNYGYYVLVFAAP